MTEMNQTRKDSSVRKAERSIYSSRRNDQWFFSYWSYWRQRRVSYILLSNGLWVMAFILIEELLRFLLLQWYPNLSFDNSPIYYLLGFVLFYLGFLPLSYHRAQNHEDRFKVIVKRKDSL